MMAFNGRVGGTSCLTTLWWTVWLANMIQVKYLNYFSKVVSRKTIIKQFNSHPQHKVVTIVTLTTISIVIKSYLPTFEGPEWWPTPRKSKHLEVLNQIKNWLREHTFYLYILTDVLILWEAVFKGRVIRNWRPVYQHGSLAYLFSPTPFPWQAYSQPVYVDTSTRLDVQCLNSHDQATVKGKANS